MGTTHSPGGGEGGEATYITGTARTMTTEIATIKTERSLLRLVTVSPPLSPQRRLTIRLQQSFGRFDEWNNLMFVYRFAAESFSCYYPTALSKNFPRLGCLGRQPIDGKGRSTYSMSLLCHLKLLRSWAGKLD